MRDHRDRSGLGRAALFLLATFLGLGVGIGTLAETFRLAPPPDGACLADGPFERVANRLKPGDELILGGGVYCQTGRRLIDVSGTAKRPIVIRAADGQTPILTRPEDSSQPQFHNGTEIRAEYLVLRGLRFRRGNRGLVFHGGSHHVTIEDSEVADTANNALTLNNVDRSHFIIRLNHIHHAGNLAASHGSTEGEGLYIGCNRASCIAHDHLIEGNYIHDLKATSLGKMTESK